MRMHSLLLSLPLPLPLPRPLALLLLSFALLTLPTLHTPSQANASRFKPASAKAKKSKQALSKGQRRNVRSLLGKARKLKPANKALFHAKITTLRAERTSKWIRNFKTSSKYGQELGNRIAKEGVRPYKPGNTRFLALPIRTLSGGSLSDPTTLVLTPTGTLAVATQSAEGRWHVSAEGGVSARAVLHFSLTPQKISRDVARAFAANLQTGKLNTIQVHTYGSN